jgi:hypothetical protein
MADKQARIKKIMQLDEEVGKLASATPVMICACGCWGVRRS